MKTMLPMLMIILVLAGCSDTATVVNVDASVPYVPGLESLIGRWASDGELALIVERDGEELFVRNPQNDTWRFEISEISSDGASVTFTQRSYVSDGTAHPFNGVPCKCTISPVVDDPTSLKYRLTSAQLPDGESEVFTRLE